MSFSFSVERLVDRWCREGLIDDATASRLRADLEKRAPYFSLGAVLATLGGLLLGAAVIMLVAANWQEIPRLMRIGLIVMLIWASYLGGAWRQSLGERIIPTALYILGAASFGAGIALVGQMYHLSGDGHFAALIWAGGVLASAFLLRAPILAAVGSGIALFYLATHIFDQSYGDLDYIWAGPLLAFVSAAAALFTNSLPAAHFVALFVISWALMIYSENESGWVLTIMIIVGIVLMLADAFAHRKLQDMTRFAHPLASYGLLLTIAALGVFQMDQFVSSIFDSSISADILFAILILALSVAALALCGRDNGGLRTIAYAAFSVEVLYLAFETVGTMIGTSGFFLTAGIIVLLLAAFVRRMEKRFSRRRQTEASHA